MFDNRIRHLEEAHSFLERKLDEMMKHPHTLESDIQEIKKRKLKLKDDIAMLKQKQQVGEMAKKGTA